MSMNCWLNPLPGKSWNDIGTGYGHQRIFRKHSNIVMPGGPSQLNVFIDESPIQIDDGFFVCDLSQDKWINVPATYHAGGGCLSYADGHAEIKNWRDRNVLNFNAPTTTAVSKDAGSTDLNWLQQRSTVYDSTGGFTR